ncbi:MULTISPECIES: hypothetical protein [unclassified Serratia (in: enterobacteria)]|uniref:hypothetical protein n=1 Tax=unclassified Serratia (in: enterobacteria) TaxID=2647522 RepID=UPI0030763B5F
MIKALITLGLCLLLMPLLLRLIQRALLKAHHKKPAGDKERSRTGMPRGGDE